MKKYSKFVNEKIGEMNIEPYPIIKQFFCQPISSDVYLFETENYLYACPFINNPALMNYFDEYEFQQIEFFKGMYYEQIKEELNKATCPSFMVQSIEDIKNDYKFAEIRAFGDEKENLKTYYQGIGYNEIMNNFSDVEITNEKHPLKVMSTIFTIY